MGATSLADAKSDLFSRLTSNADGTPHASLTKITHVYDHEPRAGDTKKPMPLTISTAGMSPEAYTLALRIYSDASKSVPLSQSDLDVAILQVDGRVGSEFGPSDWTVQWVEELDAFVATNTLQAGREDYF